MCKVYARVVLACLQQLAERVYPESQCGFRAERSTVDMIFSTRNLQEKCREQQKPLYIAFIDLTKAFDLVSLDGLFNILLKIGCPPNLHSMIRSFHDDMKATIQYEGSMSEPFNMLVQYCRTDTTREWLDTTRIPKYIYTLSLSNDINLQTERLVNHCFTTRTNRTGVVQKGTCYNMGRISSCILDNPPSQHQKRCEARLRPCPDTLWHLLLPPSLNMPLGP